MKYGEIVASGRRNTAPEGAQRVPAFVHDPSRVDPEGHYALLAWDATADGYAIKLYNAAAEQVHSWPLKPSDILNQPMSNENSPHAMDVLPDGSAIFSLDRFGLIARIDACGDAIWHRDGFHHHSFAHSADGGIWTWFGQNTGYGQIQDLLKFDPMTGEEMARISFNDDIIKRDETSALAFSLYPDFRFTPDDEKPVDIFHPNDLEELLPEMADDFPQFEAGDLMFSLRETNQVMVVSPQGEIKWNAQGPWIKQHDPDFEPGGVISVYNNATPYDRSGIITMNPQTREVRNALPGYTGPFHSNFRGKHQLLPNGNRLVLIPEQGQAFEIAPDGAVVMEFNNVPPHQPDYNEDLGNAKWLPGGFFETFPSCSQ